MFSIPSQLRAARRAGKLTQKQVGARLGLPQSHLSAIEAGKVDPRLSSIVELGRLLDLELVLVPRRQLSAVRALVTGSPDEPLWRTDGADEEEDGEEGT